MDFCPSCRRHLEGALACPGCGTPVGFLPHGPGRPHGPGPAGGPTPPAPAGNAPRGGPGSAGLSPEQPPPTERVYRAKPFPYDPPPEALLGVAPEETSRGSDEGTIPEQRSGEDTGGAGHASKRPHGRRARRARPGRGKRVLALAAGLGVVLAVLTVSEVGSPHLPWNEAGSSEPTQPSENAGSGTEQPDGSTSPSNSTHPSPSDTDRPTHSESASPGDEPSRTPSSEPTDEPTEEDTTAPPPTPEQPSPTEPPPSTPPPTQDEPPDDDDCWLIFCR